MRRALCIGIDNYPGHPLQGCVNDAKKMASLLRNNEDGSPNFDVRLMIAPVGGSDTEVTRGSLRQAVDSLFRDPAQVVVLSFSGHGTENNLGGYLVTQDAAHYDDGVAMADVLAWANGSRADEVVIFLDCCHSGHLGALLAVDNSRSLLREGVSIVTASRGDQTSLEVGGGGVFTSLVVDALSGGAADLLGHVTVPSIYASVEAALGAWDQRPLFKSHVSKVVPLRKCAPPIDVRVLRSIPELFPLPAEDFPLSPHFEPKFESCDPAKVELFQRLQLLNRVHLVVPVGTAHMYDAAMSSSACRLTPAGRYYWRLARDQRI